MDDSITGALSPQTRAVLSAALVVLFAVWILTKQLGPVRAVLAKYHWGRAIFDVVLVVVAVFSLGHLTGLILGALGLEHLQAKGRTLSVLLIYLACAAGAARLIEAWVLSRSRDGAEHNISQLAKTFLYSVCLFVGLLTFVIVTDYAPTELYVSAGALAAFVAFAMQQTLGDLFSGIAVSIERPFRIGDWIRMNDGTEGEVMDINWRATRLRGWDNTTFVIPNGLLARESFTNLHGRAHLFAPWYYVRISGEADPKMAKALLEEAARRCSCVMRHPAPVARLIDGTTIPYTYMVWVHFENYPAMFAGREELYREIHYGLREAGLQTATDIQEVRLRPADMPPPSVPTTSKAG